MRHRKSGTKLGKSSSHRNAMLRNMVTSLLKYERIHTTDAKAKVLRGWADHLITLAKRGDLHARRQAMAVVQEESVVHKLFAEARERFAASASGYTRIVKIGPRPGDAAPMSLIELIASTGKSQKKTAKKAPAAKAVSEPAPKPAEAAPPAAPAAPEVEAAPAEAEPVPEAAAPAEEPEPAASAEASEPPKAE